MLINLQLDRQKYLQIQNKGYSLDIIYLLKEAELGLLDEDIKKESKKVENSILTAVRKGLLTEDLKISLEGKEILSFLSSQEGVKLVKNKVKDDGFDKWWKCYPGTPNFTYKGKSFTGDRSMRVKKEDCKSKIKSILNEGEYTIEDLISALQLEIHQKMETSYKTGQNKMIYFQNSLTYLNQRTFEAFIELVRAGHKIEEKQTQSNETYI